MRTLTVDLFVSVDGWAGSADSPGYFGYFGPELGTWIETESAAPQLVIMGRRTYQALAGLPDEAKDDSWRQLSEMDAVVFSSTLTGTAWPNTRICGEDLVMEITRLKRDTDGAPLRTMGSLSLVTQLLNAGLVDRLRLMTFPLVVGASGSDPAFADVVANELELVDHTVLDGRILLIEYRPTGRDIPRG
jgi:dihydrofolate reductase